MAQYVGLDVSVKKVSICVVNTEGAVLVTSRTVQTDPDEIGEFIEQHAPNAERVVRESGIMAIWVTRELSRRHVPIICIDARLAHKALSGRINMTDRGDAEGLAHLARLLCIACTALSAGDWKQSRRDRLVHAGAYPQRSLGTGAGPDRHA